MRLFVAVIVVAALVQASHAVKAEYLDTMPLQEKIDFLHDQEPVALPQVRQYEPASSAGTLLPTVSPSPRVASQNVSAPYKTPALDAAKEQLTVDTKDIAVKVAPKKYRRKIGAASIAFDHWETLLKLGVIMAGCTAIIYVLLKQLSELIIFCRKLVLWLLRVISERAKGRRQN